MTPSKHDVLYCFIDALTVSKNKMEHKAAAQIAVELCPCDACDYNKICKSSCNVFLTYINCKGNHNLWKNKKINYK